MTRIEGDRVGLRPARPQDAPYLLQWALDPEVARLARGDYPTTLEATLEWLEQGRKDRYRQLFIIEGPDGKPIGDIDLHHIAWRSGEAELRIRIGLPRLWNQGLGTDAVRALLRYAFSDRHLRRIYLRVLRSNPRAIRCYEKSGFRKEGRMQVVEEDGSVDELLLMSVTKDRLQRMQESGPPPAHSHHAPATARAR
ncbi:GNAT family N-acetyltransferase [Carboxydochorda subterranea]|uniref:GNAT family N-acetyltransferase n=1 Tax=Carboxydichorda subterranea TaxID=3109565 RepID=A0ABZ1C134_9FIRM|nr:GNAT family N-acetyltransferase [Limnochorda sp. L945t]WRP18496.1 GNAT family N-acetyltransferase [Limnochorda sp. L945t]